MSARPSWRGPASADPQADRAEALGTNERLRKRCRNLRCRSKLPAPTDNDRAAFCCRGCFDQFHRSRCVVCGEAFQRKTAAQRVCWGPRCGPNYAAGARSTCRSSR